MDQIRAAAAAAHLWLWVLVPATAIAAEHAVRTLEGGPRAWFTFAIVCFLSLVGYAGSSLTEWAKWRDGDQRTRFALYQSAFVAMLAGGVTYYGGYYWLPDWKIVIPEVGCFILTALAGFAGDRWLNALVDALITTLKTVVDRVRPNGEAK